MEESKRYELRKYAVAFASFALNIGVLIYVLQSGLTLRLRDFAASVSASPWITVAIYVAVLGGALKIIQLPLGFYSGYVMEHQFGLSRETLWGWTKDQLLGSVIGGALGLTGAGLMYYLMRVHPDNWWIFTALLFIAFAVLMTNLAPVLLLPLFFKFRPIENSDLQRRVERLAQRTRTRLCGIFEWSLGEKTRKANAAVVGWGNTRRIIVSDTLLQNFSPEEVEVIMAHELCHHVKNHVWQAIAMQSALTMAGFYVVHKLLIAFSTSLGFQSVSDVANFPFIALTGTALSLIALPAVNSFSRKLERDADLYAIDLTSDGLAFVSSMEKLARLNLASTSPHPFIEFIFHSHPSIENRIRMAADRVVPAIRD
jgi:STE24 endopeptidase